MTAGAEKPWRPTAKTACLLGALLPPLCLVALVGRWGVALPYWDQFALVPLLAELQQSSLDLAAVWAPHNEHRLFVPQLVMLAMGPYRIREGP